MNDRYLFKAKRIDDGKWIICNLIDSPYGKNAIAETSVGWLIHEVDPTTLCQCTGLKDRNGQLIWENDICIIENRSFDEEDGRFLVEWDNDDAMFELSGANIDAGFGFVHNFDCEVVGNIFDNPELLGNDDTGLERK